MAKKGKTHKATKKRFKLTNKGKLIHKRQMDNDHLKANKSNRTKARQKKSSMLKSKNQVKKLKKLLIS